MTKKPHRGKPPPDVFPDADLDDGKTPLERTAELTRRIVAVPKSEIPTKPKPKMRRRP